MPHFRFSKGTASLGTVPVFLLLFSLFQTLNSAAQDTALARRAEHASTVPSPLKPPLALEVPHAPNANAIYQALRNRMPNGEAFTVSGVVLHRDAAVFTQ